jgi:hypothetical protein
MDLSTIHINKKKVPVNSGMKYFKWTCQTRMFLLHQCLDKEVWKCSYGQKAKKFEDVCTVLKKIANFEDVFASITWRKCQEEFESNISQYQLDKSAVPFNSGTAEDHTRWQDVMEEISTLVAEYYEENGGGKAQTQQSLQQDLKVAGELVRNAECSNFVTSKTKSAKRGKVSNKDVMLVQSDAGFKECRLQFL